MTALDDLDFQAMLISDVFETHRQAPSWLNTNQVIKARAAYAHVTNTALGNSVSAFIGRQNKQPNPGNAITIGIDTQVVAYQPAAFYGATKVFELRSPRLNPMNAMVLVTSLKLATEKFSWGHKASARRLLRTRIMVPVTTNPDGSTDVDWEGLDALGSELLNVAIERMLDSLVTDAEDSDIPPDLTYEPRFITDTFESMRASRAWYDKSKLDPTGDAIYPFVSRTEANNGVDGFCSRQEKEPEPGNAITIGLDTQTVAYQAAAFYTGQNIQVLRHKHLNANNALVLVALIKQQMVKFNWGGGGATLGRLKKTRIMVPVTTNPDGSTVVDWDGMTQYGHALRVRAERSLGPVMELAS